MSREEDCWASIEGLIEKSEDSIKLVLNHYGYDSFERKVKFLESALGLDTSTTNASGASYEDYFTVLCQYLKDRDTANKPKTKFTLPLEELAKMANVRTVNVSSELVDSIVSQLTKDNEKEQEETQAEVSTIASDIAKMIDDLSAEEQHRVYATVKKLHEKYERDPEEVAFEDACEHLGIQPCQEAWDLFKTGLNFRR